MLGNNDRTFKCASFEITWGLEIKLGVVIISRRVPSSQSALFRLLEPCNKS